MKTLSILAYSNLSLDDVMYYYYFFYLSTFCWQRVLKREKKRTLTVPCTGPSQDWASCLVLFTPPQTGRLFVRCNGHMTSLGFQTQLRVGSSSFFGFSVIIASAMERIGVFLVCVMFLGAVSTASVKYKIWNLVLTCRIPANLVDLLSTSFQEKLRSEFCQSMFEINLINIRA